MGGVGPRAHAIKADVRRIGIAEGGYMGTRDFRCEPGCEWQWCDLRRRDLLCRLVTISFLPRIALSLLGVIVFRSDVPHGFGIWVGGGWIAALFAAQFYRLFFRCPRCTRYYFQDGLNRQPHAQNCLHCGLRRVGRNSDRT